MPRQKGSDGNLISLYHVYLCLGLHNILLISKCLFPEPPNCLGSRAAFLSQRRKILLITAVKRGSSRKTAQPSKGRKKDAEAVRFRFEGHAWTKRVMCGILAWIARCIADLHGSGALFLLLENEKTSETVCFPQPLFIRATSFQKKQIYVLLTPYCSYVSILPKSDQTI